MASTATVTPAPRLAPSPRLRGILPRLMRVGMRLFLGKVASMVGVVYARLPGLAWAQMWLELLAHRGLSLDRDLRHLIEARICFQNTCTFCADLAGAVIVLEGGSEVPPEHVSAEADDPRFDPATRAALRYVDELGRDRTVSEPTFRALLEHFSERQVVEIVWLTAFTHYHNLMAKPLGLTSDGLCDLARARRSHQRKHA